MAFVRVAAGLAANCVDTLDAASKNACRNSYDAFDRVPDDREKGQKPALPHAIYMV